MRRFAPALALLSAALVGGACSGEPETQQPETQEPQTQELIASDGIEGSYRLTSRDLPDGSTLEPPEIFGYWVYADGHRTFHLYVPGPDGQPSSFQSVSTYELTPTEYSQTPLYSVNIEGTVPTYEFSGSPMTSSVTTEAGTIEFRDVGENSPILVFTEEGVTATLDGSFVDHWVRVEN